MDEQEPLFPQGQTKYVAIPENPDVSTGPDWLTLTLGLLGAIKLLLAAPPLEIQIPNETFDAILNLVSIIFTGIGLWKNTYISKKAQQQKSVLQQTGLKE
jgi:hypothetical protein